MVDLIFDEFPWMKHLPPADRAEFAAELTEAHQVAAATEDWSAIPGLIHAWRATAESYADPGFMAALASLDDQDDECPRSGAVHAARALRGLLTRIPAETVAESLVDEYSWTSYLPEHDRASFVADFVRAALACAELDDWRMLDQLVLEWHNTALIHTNPELVASLTEPTDGDYGPVPRPDLVP